MVKLIGMLSRFNSSKVLVIGDFMLDTYTTGKVRRISPEAPVSVLHVKKQESLPGGAGNVALNLVSLGAEVIAVGRVGADDAGEQLINCLEKEGVDVRALFTEKNFKTPVKNRFIADSQQVLRVDFEDVAPITEELEQVVIKRITSLMDDVQVVAISDYGKGFLSRTLLTATIQIAKMKSIPVIVDPKGDDFSKYLSATVLKPNLSEAYAAAKLPSHAPLDQVAKVLLESCNAKMLLVTRSEVGMSLFYKDGSSFDFPVRVKEVKDVTGAGDTVLSMICVTIANGIDIKYGAQLANIAAGIAIERLGCARINLSELSVRLLEYDVDNKVFDEEHLFALQQALRGKEYCVLGLDSSHGMSTALFKHIRTLSQENLERKLIVYVRDSDPDEEFVSLLSSLAEVDFIVLKCESLKNLCEIIHPDELFVLDKERLIELNHTEDLLSRSQVDFSTIS